MSSDEELTKYEPFSKKKMLVFALYLPIMNTFWTLRNWTQIYAAKALGIPIYLVLIMFGIYALWDAVNDPLTGNLLDRSSKFTSKYGKRFPFIVIGLIGALGTITLMFLPVSSDPLMAMLWLLIIMIVYDAFQTIYELSVSGLIVDRFRDQKQRIRLGGYTRLVGGVRGIITGISIPLLILIGGGVSEPRAYFFMAVIIIIALFLVSIPMVLTTREPEEMIELRIRLNVEGKSSSPAKVVIKRALTDKNFMSVVLAYLVWVVLMGCFSIGLTFYIVDVLEMPITAVALPTITLLLVSFVTIPLWMKIAKKVGSRKAYLYLLLWTAISVASFIFAVNYTIVIILAGLVGVAVGGSMVVYQGSTSEAIDDATLKSGIREESSYHGVLRFFSATAIFFQVLIFTIVQTITGYDPLLGPDNTDLAKFGLLLQMSLVPAACMLIIALIFWKFCTVTKEKAIENKKKLIEMGL